MPRCVIINCNSPKVSSSQRKEHISYHSFPHDPTIKEKWIAATGRKDWFPTEHSTICSKHFENISFIEGKKLRLLKKTACPTIDILKVIDNEDEVTTDADSPLRSILPNSSAKDTNITDFQTIIETPRELLLKTKLSRAILRNRRLVRDNNNLKKQNRTLIRTCRRLKESVKQLKNIVKSMVDDNDK